MTATQQPFQKQQKTRILVVEDNDIQRELFRLALRDQYLVYPASRAQDGWDLFTSKKPDLVFLDIRLPDGDGLDLARRIKESSPCTYVVMATLNDFVEAKEAASQIHADGFFTKPFNREEINDYIERFLSHKRSQSIH